MNVGGAPLMIGMAAPPKMVTVAEPTEACARIPVMHPPDGTTTVPVPLVPAPYPGTYPVRSCHMADLDYAPLRERNAGNPQAGAPRLFDPYATVCVSKTIGSSSRLRTTKTGA